MQTVAAFVRLSRLKFLLGGFAAFALGAVVARYDGAHIALPLYLAGQAMVTAFHLMTHYANDYFDRHADVHTRPAAYSGGSGVLSRGLLAPAIALRAARACAAVGTAIAVGFAANGRLVVAVLGVAIAILAWFYSAPPVRLAARGWGELDTAAIVAILVPLAGYAAVSGTLSGRAVLATVPCACAMFAMMLAVEWPDRRGDARAGKQNLVVRLSSPRAATVGTCCALGAVLALAATAAGGAPGDVVVFAGMMAPLAGGFIRRIGDPATRTDDVAAAGVALFLITVLYSLFAYAAPVR